MILAKSLNLSYKLLRLHINTLIIPVSKFVAAVSVTLSSSDSENEYHE